MHLIKISLLTSIYLFLLMGCTNSRNPDWDSAVNSGINIGANEVSDTVIDQASNSIGNAVANEVKSIGMS